MLASTRAVIEQGIGAGLHSGAQVSVRHAGQHLELALGTAGAGGQLRPDHLLAWFSSGKPLLAVLAAQLWQDDRLPLDQPLAAVLPEFADGGQGKESVTIRHLLTHTGGFRLVPGLRAATEWSEAVRLICAAPLEPGWQPGAKAGYHEATGWIVLGEAVSRALQRPLGELLRDRIIEPAGMADSYLGMSAERHTQLAPRFAQMQITAGGKADAHSYSSDPQMRQRVDPARGLLAPARDLSAFYDHLLHAGRLGPAYTAGDGGVLAPATVTAVVARHRVGMLDHTFKRHIDWGLGFALDSQHYGGEPVPYGYGSKASPRTFGHSGVQSSCAFADPEYGLAAAVGFTGLPGEPAHQQRQVAVVEALYADLGLG